MSNINEVLGLTRHKEVTCLNSSIGRDKAGVPLSNIAYWAFWHCHTFLVFEWKTKAWKNWIEKYYSAVSSLYCNITTKEAKTWSNQNVSYITPDFLLGRKGCRVQSPICAHASAHNMDLIFFLPFLFCLNILVIFSLHFLSFPCVFYVCKTWTYFRGKH